MLEFIKLYKQDKPMEAPKKGKINLLAKLQGMKTNANADTKPAVPTENKIGLSLSIKTKDTENTKIDKLEEFLLFMKENFKFKLAEINFIEQLDQ